MQWGGFGLTVLVESLNIAQVDLVYYLKTNTSNDLPEGLDVQRLTEQNQIVGRLPNAAPKSNPDIIEDQSKADAARNRKKEVFRRDFSPKALRDIAYSTLGNDWRQTNPLTIPFSDVLVNFIDSSRVYNPFQILNNSIVSLSSVNVDLQRIPQDRDGFRIIDNVSTKSIGWGWIHVNMEDRFFTYMMSLLR